MDQKLDNLTRKIFEEGVEKANKEAEVILSAANSEAEKIIEEAKLKAASIIKHAEHESNDTKKHTTADLKLAAGQAVSVLKQQIRDLITAKVIKEPMKELFLDKDFLKELIISLTKNWKADQPLELSFGNHLQDKIDKAFENSIRKEISNVEINFNKRLADGFRIAPKDSSFQITFTDDDFTEFFKSYVSEKSRKILFN